VALTIFVPAVNYFLLKYLRLPAHWADLWIARGSIVLTTVAFLVMGAAAHPALLIIGLLVFNMGTGYNAAMRSVAIHVVGGQASPDIGRLFAVIAIVESIGIMVAGPLLAEFFDWGIRMGEPWIGLPYIASAGVFAVITVVTFILSVKGKDTTLAYAEIANEDFEERAMSPNRRHQD
jgi:MFS family permease